MSGPRRVEELLAERATQGLQPAENEELESLLAASPEVDRDGFDLAAAAIDLALTAEIEPMPSHLRQAVADRAVDGLDLGALSSPQPLTPVADFEQARLRRERPTDKKPTNWTPWLAAAAALILAVAGWWPRFGDGGRQGVATAPSAESTAQAPDAIRWTWSGTDDVAVGEIGGEVVWSGSEQRGFLRIRGLAANDPSLEQYQLWIFDRGRDERFPVDGGVFDISTSAEAVIPIDAKIAVGEPYLFAVTVEKPGGVVVSSRERIVLLAQARPERA